MRGEPGRPARTVVLVAAVLMGVGVAADPADATRRAPAGEDRVATLTEDDQLFLEAPPAAGEGLLAFTRRFTGDAGNVEAVALANGGPTRLLDGVRYRVPYDVLLPELQLLVVRALFPEDVALPSGWLHRLRADEPAQSLWQIASWLTGEGSNFRRLRDASAESGRPLEGNEVPSGGSVLVPRALLLPVFGALLPPEDVEHELRYAEEGGRSYGVYRLRAGEALYSAVVVRFTGRTRARDVNAYALQLARENGIPDVSDMPVGQPVRIPFEELLPEFLPVGHPRRLEYERARLESDRYQNPVRVRRLEGITVIVDPGHGGQDPGTIRSGVWESVHVYDIALRVRKVLIETTAADVVLTTSDGDGFVPADGGRLAPSRRHAVLTDPAYPIEDSKVGVNLRWYLANSVHRRAVAASGDADKTVFVSIHAESLHPSIRGAMAYIPAASLTEGEFGRREAVYHQRREVREQPRLSFPWKQRVRSEGLSRQLAEAILVHFRRRGLAVHHEKPVRDRIIRSRNWTFVPAVIRYNAVPAKLLLEVCNLNNEDDLALVQTRRYRQEVAEAVVEGILEYYGENEPPPGRVASGNRSVPGRVETVEVFSR